MAEPAPDEGRPRMEMLVLDQTHPDVGLALVKVIAPGLRYFWPRFGPGAARRRPREAGLAEQAAS